jgi:DNA-binding NarL/FixJ family response regulator
MVARAKIIIVDDHLLFREGMRLLIDTEEYGEVIAEASDGHTFLNFLDNNMPDLVLMDIDMPVMGGLEATIRAMTVRPYLKILVLTMYCLKKDYADLINAGVRGIVLKTSGKQNIEKAIKTVIAGGSYFSNELLRPNVS